MVQNEEYNHIDLITHANALKAFLFSLYFLIKLALYRDRKTTTTTTTTTTNTHAHGF